MKILCIMLLIVCTVIAHGECWPEAQYCSVARNTHITVPRGTVSVGVNCWQAELRKRSDTEPWQATGHKSTATTGTYCAEIPGKADVELQAYQGERPEAWPACTVEWTVDYEK